MIYNNTIRVFVMR